MSIHCSYELESFAGASNKSWRRHEHEEINVQEKITRLCPIAYKERSHRPQVNLLDLHDPIPKRNELNQESLNNFLMKLSIPS